MLRTTTLILFTALVGASCAGQNLRNAETGPPIVVEVQNNNFQDATVYLFRDGERTRLGIVTGKTDQTFAVPWRANLYLRFEVRFIGGGACATRRIPMEPGQRYVLELQPDLRVNLDCEPIG